MNTWAWIIRSVQRLKCGVSKFGVLETPSSTHLGLTTTEIPTPKGMVSTWIKVGTKFVASKIWRPKFGNEFVTLLQIRFETVLNDEMPLCKLNFSKWKTNHGIRSKIKSSFFQKSSYQFYPNFLNERISEVRTCAKQRCLRRFWYMPSN